MICILSSNVEFGVIDKSPQEIGLSFATAVRAAHCSEGSRSMHYLSGCWKITLDYSLRRQFLFLSPIFILGPLSVSTEDSL